MRVRMREDDSEDRCEDKGHGDNLKMMVRGKDEDEGSEVTLTMREC
jgi:hypothetical protein